MTNKVELKDVLDMRLNGIKREVSTSLNSGTWDGGEVNLTIDYSQLSIRDLITWAERPAKIAWAVRERPKGRKNFEAMNGKATFVIPVPGQRTTQTPAEKAASGYASMNNADKVRFLMEQVGLTKEQAEAQVTE